MHKSRRCFDCALVIGFYTVVPAVIMGLVGIHSRQKGLNTGGVGVLTDVSAKRFNVCSGEVSFTTEEGQQVVARLRIPCSMPGNYTELPIDICYNWIRPELVGYNGKGSPDPCSDTGHNAANRLIIAAIVMLLLFVFLSMMSGCLDLTGAEQGHAEDQVQLQEMKAPV